jgi:hypothetical protein
MLMLLPTLASNSSKCILGTHTLDKRNSRAIWKAHKGAYDRVLFGRNWVKSPPKLGENSRDYRALLSECVLCRWLIKHLTEVSNDIPDTTLVQ